MRKRLERGVEGIPPASVIHSETGTGAVFHKIKAALFGETRCFTATVYRERFKAEEAGGCEEKGCVGVTAVAV